MKEGEAMPTRNVNLTDHYDQFVESQVSAGRYQNASEVMRRACAYWKIGFRRMKRS